MRINTLIGEENIKSRIKELADEIQKDSNGEEVVLIAILKGSVFFATELAKSMSSPIIMDFIKVSSYSGTQSTGKISFKLDLSENVENKNVIIVEDIVDTGRTLTYLKDYILINKHPKSLKICTLLDKKERREFELNPDYVGFDIPDKFVIGYGLDYDEKYRNLPYIGYIEQ